MNKDHFSRIQNNNLFKNISEEEIVQLKQYFSVEFFTKGDEVCHVGQEANGMYLLLSGQMTVCLKEEKVSTLSSGQFFGLMGYMSKEQTRNAHIFSATDTEVCVIKYEDLAIIEKNFPEIFIQLQTTALLSWMDIIEKSNQYHAAEEKKVRSLASFCCTAMFVLCFKYC